MYFFCIIGIFSYIPTVFAIKTVDTPPYASGSKPEKNTEQAKANALQDPHYESCGQECLLHKGQEQLTIQLLYMDTKRKYLEGLLPTDESGQAQIPSNIQIDNAKQILGSYCTPDEEVVDCKTRFMKLSAFWILKLRTALRNNYAQIAKLHSQAPTNAILLQENSNSKKLLPQVPYLSTSNELKTFGLNQVQDTAAYDSMQPELFTDCKKQPLGCYRPSEEDFIRFKKIPDPSNPHKTLSVPDCDNSGKCKKDLLAYQNALSLWEGSIENGGYGGDQQFQSDILNASGGKPKQLLQNLNKQKISTLSTFTQDPKTQETERPTTQQIYDTSRAIFVNSFNQQNAKQLNQLNRAGGLTNSVSFQSSHSAQPAVTEVTGNEKILIPNQTPTSPNMKQRESYYMSLGVDQIGLKSSKNNPPQEEDTYLNLDF